MLGRQRGKSNRAEGEVTAWKTASCWACWVELGRVVLGKVVMYEWEL